MKALVLDAHAAAGLAAVQALGRDGVEVHAASHGECLAFSSRYLAKSLIHAWPLEPSAMIEWLRQVESREAYDLIVPSTELSLGAFQTCADDDPLRRKAVLASRRSVEVALDKIQSCNMARELGIPVPTSRVIESLDGASPPASYPVVLKTARSHLWCDGALVYAPVRIARNEVEWRGFLERWVHCTPVQQQDYFAGHGWAVECLYAQGELRWSFAHERLHELPLTGGGSSYRRSVTVPEPLLRCAQRLLDALGWHGVAMVEFRVGADGEFVFLEVNPRLWGSLPLAITSGVNFPLGLCRLATGAQPGDQPAYRIHRYARNLPADLEWMRANWKADHTDPLLLTHGRVRSLVEWARPLAGRESWDHFDWADLRPILRQLAEAYHRLRGGAASRIKPGMQIDASRR